MSIPDDPTERLLIEIRNELRHLRNHIDLQDGLRQLRDLVARMDGKLTTVLQKESILMSITDELVARVQATTDEERAAHMALDALQAAIADLKTQLANGVDPAVVAKAITDLGTSAADLATAIPAAPTA